MMNSILACSSGGWLTIATSVVVYSALGLAIFSLIKDLFPDAPLTVPATTGTSNQPD